MGGHGAKLDRKQEQAIAALLSQPTVEAAANAAGISEKTLKNWLALPEFQAAYRAARQDILDRTVVRLLAASGKAIDTLEANLCAPRPGDQIRAAQTILSHATAGVELLDLAERVKALEERGT